MAWQTLRWINLRATSGHVTDGTNQVAFTGVPGDELNVRAYPVSLTVAGDTFDVGYASQTDGARNVTNPGDVRLAGCHIFGNSGTQRELRIDLGAARTINLHLAFGRAAGSNTNNYWQVLDGTTVLETFDKTGTTATEEEFFDATGTLRTSAANWVANQTAKQYTIATGVLRIRFGTPTSGSGSTALATVGIQELTDLAANAATVASASATLSAHIQLGANAAGVASASAALTTAIRLAMAAVSNAAATGVLTTEIRLSADATALATATGVFAGGAVLQATASDVASAVAQLSTEILLSGAAAATASATGALVNWASVTLAGALYTGPGGVLDPNFWVDAVPALGTKVYYDPTHITIYPNGEISSDSNNCTAIVQFFDGTSWALGLVVITPHMVAYARDVASASAQLSTAIQLAAAASALVTATGAFSTAASLSATASDTASATGSLTTGIPLSALAANVSSAVAGLTTQIRLAATATDTATATANLNGVISLDAAAHAIASALGTLSTQIRLGAIASSTASVSGSLSTVIRLDGTAQDVVSASAALSAAITMGGSANSIASASAELTTAKPLFAAAIDVATAVATLSTGLPISANAQAISQASGALTAAIRLVASAASEARASAVLTDVIETPPVGVYASDPRFVIAKTRWSFFGSQRTPMFERKDPSEKVVLTFDFSGVLATDETLSGPITLTIIATSGTDAAAIDLFNGYPAYDMTMRKILQPVKAGVNGCHYYVKVSAATTNGKKTLALSGLLPVEI